MPTLGVELPPRHRRDQPAARAADDLPDPARAGLGLARHRGPGEGVRHHHARPGDGHARRLRQPRPLPVLRLLGGDARSRCTSSSGCGAAANRVYAAVKFILYTMVGSLLMLVAILALYFQHGQRHRDLHLRSARPCARFVLPPGLGQNLMFLAFALAFAIKVPLFPVPHLAARRPRGGAHRGHRDPGRRPAEDGHLRLPALLPAAVPRREPGLRAARLRPRRDRHHLRGAASPPCSPTSRSWWPTRA